MNWRTNVILFWIWAVATATAPLPDVVLYANFSFYFLMFLHTDHQWNTIFLRENICCIFVVVSRGFNFGLFVMRLPHERKHWCGGQRTRRLRRQMKCRTKLACMAFGWCVSSAERCPSNNFIGCFHPSILSPTNTIVGARMGSHHRFRHLQRTRDHQLNPCSHQKCINCLIFNAHKRRDVDSGSSHGWWIRFWPQQMAFSRNTSISPKTRTA